MKKMINNLIFANNSIVSGLIALSVILMIGLGCFCNKDKLDAITNGSNTSYSPTPGVSPSPSPTKAYTRADASKYEVPSDDEMQDIVKTTLLDFNDALQKEDFTDFHRKISKEWQKQVTPQELKTNFQSFIDGDADLSGIRSLKAKFTTPARIEGSQRSRTLKVNGEYATTPRNSTFELTYVPEGKEWKLFGLRVITGIKTKP